MKNQSAMEYLMTYGWAILIIAIVLAALFSLGVFNSGGLSAKAPPGSCRVFRPQGPGTATNLNFQGVCTGVLPQYVAQFNGGSSYILCALASCAGNFGASSAFSMSLWMYASSTVPNGVRYAGTWSQTGNQNNTLLYSGGSVNGVAFYASLSGNIIGTGTYTIQPRTWYNIVGVATGSNVLLYVNGVLYSSVAQPAGKLGSSNLGFWAGRETDLATYFNGEISNLQFYTGALDANSVAALYGEGIGGAPVSLSNLALWWPLNGDALDYSGNGNNGAPSNVVFTTSWSGS